MGNPSPFDEDDPRALPPASHTPGTKTDQVDSLDQVPERRGMRQIAVARSSVNTVLDQGPGMFLRGVELKPHFHGDHFDGWEIVQFMPGEARFDAVDLYPGDIIGLVNGRSVARPQQLAELWGELRTASAIVITVRRGGEAFDLRFDITEEIKPPTP